jgi:hypothetical protein
MSKMCKANIVLIIFEDAKVGAQNDKNFKNMCRDVQCCKGVNP